MSWKVDKMDEGPLAAIPGPAEIISAGQNRVFTLKCYTNAGKNSEWKIVKKEELAF
jgi:hypothetical protein